MRKKAIITFAVFVALLLAFAAVYQCGLAPKPWTSGADTAATGVDETGAPWIGAATPKLVVHEYLDFDCPHCPQTHRTVRTALAGRLDTVRLVRHDYARMPCKPNDDQTRYPTCEMARAAICAGEQISYWQWNDAVITSPRADLPSIADAHSYVDKLRDTMNLDAAAFAKCLYAANTIDRAQAIYDRAEQLRINSTPTYIIDGRKMTVRETIDKIRAAR